MTWRLTTRTALLSLFCGVIGLGIPTPSHGGPFVLPGWDLFATVQDTTFQGITLTGVPLGTHDFGAPFGVQNTGNADTIVRRLDRVDAPSGTTRLVMEALQLMSTQPVPQFGNDFIYYTLQSVHGGPATTGEMTINFGPEGQPHGTFSSFFDVFFDLRTGSVNGPIIFSNTTPIRIDTAGQWGHQAPPNAVLISGVNFLLNGVDIGADFFPIGVVREVGPPGTVHSVVTATVPEPASLLLLGSGLLGLTLRMRRTRH